MRGFTSITGPITTSITGSITTAIITTAAVTAASVATLAALSACGPVPSTPATASTRATEAPEPDRPDCGSIHIGYDQPIAEQHVECALRVDDDLRLDVSGDPAWSFTLRSGGAEVQTFTEATEAIGQSGEVPMLQDIDADGRPELLVIIARGGTGGEPMAVWRLDSQARYVRAGELFGFRRFFRTDEGFFGNYAHSSAASGVVRLYRWVDDRLTGVVTLDVQVARAPRGEHRWTANGDTLCRVADNVYGETPQQRRAALEAAGIDPATAEQRFCTQPWVATIYTR